jgi:predicted DNA-binding ribbon-helix-helix protein
LSGLQKRSLTIAGHRTSLALESGFWRALAEIAESRGLPLAALVREIDEQRNGGTLSSAARVHVLDWYRSRIDR